MVLNNFQVVENQFFDEKYGRKVTKPSDAKILWHNIRKAELFLVSLIRPVMFNQFVQDCLHPSFTHSFFCKTFLNPASNT
jgi:hypothetical protein